MSRLYKTKGRSGVTALLAACVTACTSAGPTADRGIVAGDTFDLRGDPESSSGATWSFTGVRDGVRYDLQGVLFKPAGSGPFPAVIISHGAGGNAGAYSRQVASEMVRWGLVCIGTNYTHAGGAPLGSPGTADERGASNANVLRAHQAREILRALGYVDLERVAAHGHSMGGFVTAALVSAYPTAFRVASHSAGGVRPPGFASAAAPDEAQVRNVRVPYQIHHGDADNVVPLDYDRRFANILTALSVQHELHIYPGAGHTLPASPVMERVRNWYATHGMF